MADGGNGDGNGAQEQPGNSPKKAWGTPFQPGQSGNPGGRPVGSVSFRRRFQIRATQEPGVIDELYDVVRAIALDPQHRDCLKAAELLIESNDGKQVQPVDMALSVPLTVRDNSALPELPQQAPELVNRLRNGDGQR